MKIQACFVFQSKENIWLIKPDGTFFSFEEPSIKRQAIFEIVLC